jgi:hypothetical protein
MRAIVGPLVIAALLVASWALFVRGNPGGISDAKYAEFKQLAPPRILYSCTRKPTNESLLQQQRECAKVGRSGCEQKAYDLGESETKTVVEFVGSQGTSTYDELLRDATRNCARNIGSMGSGKLKVVAADKD